MFLFAFVGIVGRNPKGPNIVAFIMGIAPYYKTVTTTGETGGSKSSVPDPALTYVNTRFLCEIFTFGSGLRMLSS
ncbi:MAG: hypothetical protein ABSD38_22565 [Syntrophorhabdales bacterium]|jgi:hypothetical protein